MNALDGSNKHQQFIETLPKKIHMMRDGAVMMLENLIAFDGARKLIGV
jgi:hypothetical protein